MRTVALIVMLCAICGTLFPKRASATTIIPLTWQQMAQEADFIGVVECITAGGIVAGYRVEDSWKGAPAGSELRLSELPNYWGPQYPITLCGERVLVIAFKTAPANIASTTSGGPVPLWWRNLSADYQTPLFQGRWPLDGERLRDPFGGNLKLLQEVKLLVRGFLAKPADVQELNVLKSVAKRTFDASARREARTPSEKSKRHTEVAESIQEHKDAKALVTYLFRAGGDDTELAQVLLRILREGGGDQTLNVLQSMTQGAGKGADDLAALQLDIQDRLSRPLKGQAVEDHEGKKPVTEERLQSARAQLAKTPWSEEGYEAFQLLTVHAPDAVADKLLSWIPPDDTSESQVVGYSVGSFFGFRCGDEREANFKKLLKARDAYVRTAAAVYLAIENPSPGKQALKELASLPGGPGEWAALTLVRRGDKDAMDKALELLDPAKESNMNFQAVLLTVLSNSAKRSGVEQPPRVEDYLTAHDEEGYEKEAARFFKETKQWWATNEAAITLIDPWLEELDKQKVD